MSSWDRQAAVARYEDMFDRAEDPEALMEQLGTPTKVAVSLADGYVSSPPPALGQERPEPEPEAGTAEEAGPMPGGPEYEPVPASIPEPDSGPAAPSEPEPNAETWPVAEPAAGSETRGAGGAVRALYWLFAVVIGLPVTVLLICLGVPFLVGGAVLLYSVIHTVPGSLSAFPLVSDMLLLGGAGLGLLALGLLLAWFGLWLSVALCRLWMERVLFRLWKKVSGRP